VKIPLFLSGGEMKYITLIASFLIFSIPAFAQAPDTLWTKHLKSGGTEGDTPTSVKQTQDGGFIISGIKHLEGGADGLLLIKTDSMGDTLWMRTVESGSIQRTASSVIETFDGRFVTVGLFNNFGREIWLTKWSASGEFLGEKIYDNGGTADEAEDIAQSADSGFIIAGTTVPLGQDFKDVWLLKTDSEGDTIWTRTFGGVHTDIVRSIQQTSDGGYILVGYTQSFGQGQLDIWLLKTDSEGDTLWTKTFGGTLNDFGFSVQQTMDGGYLIIGITNSFGEGEQDIWLLKTDSLGDTTWTKTFGDSLWDAGFSGLQTQDGGYILTGSSCCDDSGFQDIIVIRTDSLGNKIWSKSFGSALSSSERGVSIQQLADNGYIVLGKVSSDSDIEHSWLLRLAADPPDTLHVPSEYSTIQEALDAAEESNIVLVLPGTYTESLVWPNVNGINLLSAGDSSNTIIDGGKLGRVIYITSSAIDSTTLIKGFTIQNGGRVDDGAGIYISGSSPTLESLLITKCRAGENGGGIYVSGSNHLRMHRVSSTRNRAKRGGGLYIRDNFSIISNFTAKMDTADEDGGGILIRNGDFIRATQGRMNYIKVNSNVAGNGGGMAFFARGNPIITNLTVLSNSATGAGGGIYFDWDLFPQFFNVTVSNNNANVGGGIYAGINNVITFTNLLITDNSAHDGGGIYAVTDSMIINSVHILRNTANFGGGIYSSGGILIFNDGGVISNNEASINGGAWYNPREWSSDLTISYNSAIGGGGIYSVGGNFGIEQSNFISNTSSDGSGAITINTGNPNIINSNIFSNGRAITFNDVGTPPNASNNWWGDSTGPSHSLENPGGLGDTVAAGVAVTPWLIEPDTSAPPIPVQGLTIDYASNDSIVLSWDEALMSDFANYTIYFDTDTSGIPYEYSIDVGNVSSYSITGLSFDKTHYIAATTFDTDGNESWYSREVNVITIDKIPSVPVGFSSSITQDGVVLKWRPNPESDIDFYAIYRSLQSGFNPDTMETFRYSSTDTSFTDSFFPIITTYYYRLSVFDVRGNESEFSEELAVNIVVSIEPIPNIPDVYALDQNYPNPFNPITVLRYALPEQSNVSLVVYNLMGQQVIRWDEGNVEPGFYEKTWNGTNRNGIPVTSGIYIYRLIAGDFIQTKKMVLLK